MCSNQVISTFKTLIISFILVAYELVFFQYDKEGVLQLGLQLIVSLHPWVLSNKLHKLQEMKLII
jgi:hypothetical protein